MFFPRNETGGNSEWKPGDEPYYPVNDEKNSELYKKYRELANHEQKVIFGGRLGEYKYYDMDKTIEVALEKSRELMTDTYKSWTSINDRSSITILV